MRKFIPTQYDKFPAIKISDVDADCRCGWKMIASELLASVALREAGVVAIECYPGVDIDEIQEALGLLRPPVRCIRSESGLKNPEELEQLFAPWLGDDPVFGKMRAWRLEEFFSREAVEALAQSFVIESRGSLWSLELVHR